MSQEKSTDKIPTHVAIIMDGNGRWAGQKGLPRLEGHRAGAKAVEAVLRACVKAEVRYLTLFAFSTENWRRPKTEIAGLMSLLVEFLKKNEKDLHENQTRLRVIGRIADLPRPVRSRPPRRPTGRGPPVARTGPGVG